MLSQRGGTQMLHGERWIRKLADEMELETEALPGLPILELSGGNRLIVERHRGIGAYSRERICIKVSYGTLCILGKDLQITLMSQHQLVITGTVEEIQILRGCRP